MKHKYFKKKILNEHKLKEDEHLKKKKKREREPQENTKKKTKNKKEEEKKKSQNYTKRKIFFNNQKKEKRKKRQKQYNCTTDWAKNWSKNKKKNRAKLAEKRKPMCTCTCVFQSSQAVFELAEKRFRKSFSVKPTRLAAMENRFFGK